MNTYGQITIHSDRSVTIRWDQFDIEDHYPSIEDMRKHFNYPPKPEADPEPSPEPETSKRWVQRNLLDD